MKKHLGQRVVVISDFFLLLNVSLYLIGCFERRITTLNNIIR